MNHNKESKKAEQEEVKDQEPTNESAEQEISAEPADELSLLKEELAVWKDKYLRLYADFDNFRKNKIKERAELILTAGSDVISSLLPVLDDFDRAMAATEQINDLGAFKEGMKLVNHKLLNNLESKGLKMMDANSAPFNTDLHEAVSNITAPEVAMKGKVVDVLEKGYYLHDKVLRYAKVVVGQ